MVPAVPVDPAPPVVLESGEPHPASDNAAAVDQISKCENENDRERGMTDLRAGGRNTSSELSPGRRRCH
jgi:hypothetical protein